jgi:pimeloyl-ACP methyl ester carboxylesterase
MITTSLQRPDATLHGDSLGHGQEILLLHAGGERRRVWHPVMGYLANRGCRCVAYDQRGHGESGGGRPSSVTAFGEDTVDMISQLRMPLVVGASLGGFAALLALSNPSVERQVAGLVLVDVVPDPDRDRTRRFLAPLGMDRSPLVEDILGRRDRLREIAASLTLPVLAIRAGERTGYSDDDADRFAKLMPHAAIATVAGAGHLVARDTPIELAALLAGFLQSDGVRDRQAWGSAPAQPAQAPRPDSEFA